MERQWGLGVLHTRVTPDPWLLATLSGMSFTTQGYLGYPEIAFFPLSVLEISRVINESVVVNLPLHICRKARDLFLEVFKIALQLCLTFDRHVDHEHEQPIYKNPHWLHAGILPISCILFYT